MICTDPARTVAIVVANRKIRADRADVLGLAFGHLPHVEQRVVWLTAIERLTAAEAADVLGLDPGELGQISFRARDRLRRRMTALLRTRVPEPCREVVADLPGYALGAAPDLRAASVRTHLNECARCTVIVHTLADLPAALRARPPAEPPDINGDASLQRSAEPSPERVAMRAAGSDRSVRHVALGLAVAVLVVVGAAGLVRTTRNTDAGVFARSDPFLAPVPGDSAPFDTGTPRPASEDTSDGTEVLGIVIAANAPAAEAPSGGTPAPDQASAPDLVTEPAPPAPGAPPPGSTNPTPSEGVVALDGVLDTLLGGVLDALLGG